MRLSLSITQVQKGSKARSSGMSSLRRWGSNAIFLLPALLIFTAFVTYPFIGSLYYSLTNWDGLDPTLHFVGLANFQTLLGDSTILNDLQNTFVVAVCTVIAQTSIALLLAIVLDGLFRRYTFLRVLFLIPAMLSSLAIGYIWSYLYSPLFGFINML